MEERKDNRYMAVWICCEFVAFVLWVILITLKTAGAVRMSWPLVLSGIVWLSWIVFLLVPALVALVRQAAKLKRWYRRRKVDRRIIRQAKAIGAWDKRPTPLGGRALELKAWEDFKIKRWPGETDAQLRRRCMAKADEELAAAPREGGGHHGL